MSPLISRRIAIVLLPLCLMAAHPVAQEPATAPATADAQKAATEWLVLIDAGRYPESWTAAAAAFRKAVTQEKWQDAAKLARGLVGPLKSRTLKQAIPTQHPPGAPEGDYVVFQYGSSFENNATAIETLTTVRETDGNWRVVGYFVR